LVFEIEKVKSQGFYVIDIAEKISKNIVIINNKLIFSYKGKS